MRLCWEINLLFLPKRWKCDAKKWLIRYKTSSETDADPCKVLWVNPASIKYCTGTEKTAKGMPHLDNNHPEEIFSRHEDLGRVVEGDWDKNRYQFSDLLLAQAIKKRYVNEVPWSETQFYQKHLERIKNTGSSLRCTSEKELLERCEQTDLIYDRIKNGGYKTQCNFDNHPLTEIQICIGRNGELLFNDDGRHRLSIAKILDLEKVPVVVIVRHQRWQSIRNKIQRGKSIECLDKELFDHPDLEDIL